MSKVKVSLTRDQVDFLKEATGEKEVQKAVDFFSELMIDEGIDPNKIIVYINKMMGRKKK